MVFGDMSKFFNHIRLILKCDNHPSVITEKMMDETGFLKVPGTSNFQNVDKELI